jgi:hypothetical protein
VAFPDDDQLDRRAQATLRDAEEVLRKASEPAPVRRRRQEDVDAVPATVPVGVLLSEVEEEQVRWLWRGRIPLGKVTVLDGDPGLGKSLLTIDLAARVTTGLDMPDGSPGVDGGVVILTAEDGLGDTVRPRCRRAGGDPARIVALTVVGQGDDEHDPFLPDDLNYVEAAINRVQAKLVIVDPLMAYLPGSVNAHRDQDVRLALRQLASLAERTGAGTVVIRHLNKVGGTNALHRGGGSIGIIGAARSGMLVAKDPDDDAKRIVAMTKANLAAPVASLRYQILSDGPDAPPYVDWLGSAGFNAMQLLNIPEDQDEEAKTGIEQAIEALRAALEDGPLEAKIARKEVRDAAGVSDRTIDVAKARLHVVATRQGGRNGRWLWSLPDGSIIKNGRDEDSSEPGLKDAGSPPSAHHSRIQTPSKDAKDVDPENTAHFASFKPSSPEDQAGLIAKNGRGEGAGPTLCLACGTDTSGDGGRGPAYCPACAAAIGSGCEAEHDPQRLTAGNPLANCPVCGWKTGQRWPCGCRPCHQGHPPYRVARAGGITREVSP